MRRPPSSSAAREVLTGHLPEPLDESLVAEKPQQLLKMWERWDRRVTDHIARQQGHVPSSSYASPTRSSSGKALTTSSTTKSRRKLFLSVLGVNEPVDIAQPHPAPSDIPLPLPQLHAPPTIMDEEEEEPNHHNERETGDLVPYVPEDDVPQVVDASEATAGVAPKARKIPHDRLVRLRQRRQERSSSADIAVMKGPRSALEELAMEDQEDVREEPAGATASASAKPPKPKALRSKQHISPRAKKHLLTKVRSRQCGQANDAQVVRGAAVAVHKKSADSSNEADFASSSCVDPSDPRVARAKRSRSHAYQRMEDEEEGEGEEEASTREPSADQRDVVDEVPVDVDEEQDENEHVYAADARSARNVHWNRLHGTEHCEEDVDDNEDEEQEMYEDDGSDVDAPSQVQHASPTSAEKLLEKLLDHPEAGEVDVSSKLAEAEHVLSTAHQDREALINDETSSRLHFVYSESDAFMDVTSAFSRSLWELQVQESEVVEDEVADRLRLADAELDARSELAAECQAFIAAVQEVARVVQEEEELVRMDLVAFELESRYDFLVLPTLEATCDDTARDMIAQLDSDQAAIVEEMEALHENELTTEKEHTRTLVEEYEQLVQLVNTNSQNEKEELVRVLQEEKSLALETAEDAFRRELETTEMSHEDALSSLRQQHHDVLTERRVRIQHITATALEQLRHSIDVNETAAIRRSAFAVWRHVAARQQLQKAMHYEAVERASAEEYVASVHRTECDALHNELLGRDESINRSQLELDESDSLRDILSERVQFLYPQLNTFFVQAAPQRAEKMMLESDNESLQTKVRQLEELTRKLSHLLRAQKMTSTALASKCEQHQVLDKAQRHEIVRVSGQRNGVVDRLSTAITHQVRQRAFVRWLSLASSEPLRRLRKLRQEEQALRLELRSWHEQAAASVPRDVPPLHSPVILTNQQFVDKLRNGQSPAAAAVSEAPKKISGDEAFQALKHLLAKERQCSTSLRDDLTSAKAVIRESSDALDESIQHREALQRALRDVLQYAAANGLQVPQHVIAGSSAPQEQKTRRMRSAPAKSVGFADGAGASDPFEPGPM